MQRCEVCNEHANPWLAHLHGNPCAMLCYRCTMEAVKKIEEGLKKELRPAKAPREYFRNLMRIAA